jgi:uncharacterized protein YbcI
MKTKGEIEAENSRARVQFEIDYMGRGPKEARTYIIEDMLVVRLKGVLTASWLRKRTILIEKAKPLLYQVVGDISGTKILDLHTDISTASGERVFVFTLESNLERLLGRRRES